MCKHTRRHWAEHDYWTWIVQCRLLGVQEQSDLKPSGFARSPATDKPVYAPSAEQPQRLESHRGALLCAGLRETNRISIGVLRESSPLEPGRIFSDFLCFFVILIVLFVYSTPICWALPIALSVLHGVDPDLGACADAGRDGQVETIKAFPLPSEVTCRARADGGGNLGK